MHEALVTLLRSRRIDARQTRPAGQQRGTVHRRAGSGDQRVDARLGLLEQSRPLRQRRGLVCGEHRDELPCERRITAPQCKARALFDELRRQDALLFHPVERDFAFRHAARSEPLRREVAHEAVGLVERDSRTEALATQGVVGNRTSIGFEECRPLRPPREALEQYAPHPTRDRQRVMLRNEGGCALVRVFRSGNVRAERFAEPFGLQIGVQRVALQALAVAGIRVRFPGAGVGHLEFVAGARVRVGGLPGGRNGACNGDCKRRRCNK